jgi:acyl-CoA synthetase (AMP-forming)/AMP-acid ligase II
LFATAKLGAVMAPVNHRLDQAVITDVLMGYSPTVVVVEQASAGVSLPSGVAPVWSLVRRRARRSTMSVSSRSLLSSVRCYITGGAPVPERLIGRYLQRGVTFLQGYGLSEAAPFVLLLDPANALRKVGSAGKPPLFVDIRIVRPDGTACEPNETGELLVSGPNVMARYWERADATGDVIDEYGWLRTGDAARIDDEGFVWIVDRVHDAYEVSDHIVYAGDVERVLTQHPEVADAGVVPGDGNGKGFVVIAPGKVVSELELLEFWRTRLAAHEVPSSVTFVDRLPRSSVGKLLRHELAPLAVSDH